MEVTIITPGRLKKRYVHDGCADYLARLNHWVRMQVVEVRPESTGRVPAAVVKRRETHRILEKVKPGAFLIAFDNRGRELDSVAFARLIQRIQDGPRSRLALAIGGPLGLDQELLTRADDCLSLSRLTFPHELARLIVLEQLYRAFSIIHGLPYHNA